MRNVTLVVCLVIALLVSGSTLFAGKIKDKVKGTIAKLEAVEKTGTLEVKPAEKGEKYSTVTLTVGTEKFKLLPGKAKGIMKDVEKLAGKEISVKGVLLPATDKHPMAAIKIDSFEAKGAAAAPADASPADKPADAGSAAGSGSEAAPAGSGSEAGSAAPADAGSGAGSEAGSAAPASEAPAAGSGSEAGSGS